MDNFQIETAQNVNIFQNVAGIGERILAFMIDLVIQIAYGIAVLLLFNSLDMLDNDDHLYLIIMTVGIPIFIYHLVFESLWNGQSIGKRILKIRVVKMDGSQPEFSNYLLRWLLRLIDINLFSGVVGTVTILLNGKGQRLGDLAAGTTVITERKKQDFSRLLQMDFEEDYTPTYPQVTVFTDREMQLIKDNYTWAKNTGNHHIILKLYHKITEVMEVSVEDKPIDFIDTVIKDYIYYTQHS